MSPYFWKILGCLLFVTVECFSGYTNLKAQVTPDSVATDSVETRPAASDTIEIRGDIETTITYYAEDSIVQDFPTNVAYLYGNAKITYGNIELTAAQIEIDQITNIVTARGVPDTTGRLRGAPVFQQGAESYEADSMRYNFKTQKGVVLGIVTQQGEGYLQGSRAKRLSTGVMYAAEGKYTTCNLKHPHWFIDANKIKLIPEKQVVTGPFNLVVSDVPTPLGFAFGIFPFTDKRRSGIVFPIYGESADRGFFLRNGGYYWFINDYMAAEFLGEIYTDGSWGLDTRFTYRSRYKFNGQSSIRYARRLIGDEGNTSNAEDFWIRWSHSPVPRGRSSFSASVNFGSSRFNERNTFDPQLQISNNFNSSISYQTGFDIGGTQATLGLSIRHDQNSQSNVVNLVAPDFNFAINRIYPFKREGTTAKNFIQRISLSYSARGVPALPMHLIGALFRSM
ncbi:MAG: LPS-assembly protein LptD [Bacteroidia bacterium]|nr:LPS-assembly protein LptD [Bacteroidia bacterium]